MFWNLHCCHLSITWYSQIRSLQKRHRKRERSPNITVKKNCQTKREETKRRRKQTAKPTSKQVTEWQLNAYLQASLVSQLVKNPPAMRKTWVQCLGWEDPPGGEHGNAVFLPGESPWTEGPGG